MAPNGDGTYTLSLSVTGEASASSEASRANVVVIMDRSASMDKPSGTYDEHWHSLSKLDVEKQAADLLADSLRQYNTAEHPDAVQIALIDFGGTANLTQGATSDFDAYESAVDGVESNSNPSYDAGTNWEAALQLAKSTADSMASGDRANVPTYVVFVSDGLPTFRQMPVYTEAQLHNNSWNYYST
ncbi:MAG: VWA domain-containing protein, partial [Coriobacteriales bacterium]